MSVVGDSESVRSERSSRHHHHYRAANANAMLSGAGGGLSSHPQLQQGSRANRHRRSSASRSSDGQSIGSRMQSKNRSGRMDRIGQIGEDVLLTKGDALQEVFSDDNWGENTTCVTGNTSERSYDYEAGLKSSHARVVNEVPIGGLKCKACLSFAFSGLIVLLAFISPLAMIILPRVPFFHDWQPEQCTPDCEGLLLNLICKQVLLLIGTWALFCRRSLANYPRVVMWRTFLLAFVFLTTFAFWLFYGVRILIPRHADYTQIVTFAIWMIDALLWVHYIAVCYQELRHLRPEYRLTVVRSPDGESRCYDSGQLSIQGAALFVLQKYYRDFPLYNPFLERLPSSSAGRLRGMVLKHKQHGGGQGGNTAPASLLLQEDGEGIVNSNDLAAQFKVYDVEGLGPASGDMDPSAMLTASQLHSKISTQAIMAAAARKRDSSHNERFYLELEYERKMKRRRARLVTAAEEAFLHVKRLNEEKGPCLPMDPHDAAQAVFPAMSRCLQKFLRVTRQQPRHTADQIVRHLAQYLAFDMSPKSFLERFFSQRETVEATQSNTKWSIVCDQLVSRSITHETTFQLRCHMPGPDAGVYLLVTATKLPFFNLTEEVVNPKNNRFVLRLNSETSV